MSGEVLALAETREGKLLPVSLEVCAFAKKLGRVVKRPVSALVLSGPADEAAQELAQSSGMRVLQVKHEALSGYTAEAWLLALSAVIASRQPSYLIAPHTATGWDFSPALAVRAGVSHIAAAVGLVETSPPRFVRRLFSGRLEVETEPLPDRPAVITLLPGAEPAEKSSSAGEVVDLPVETGSSATRNLGYAFPARGGLDLSRAEVIVAGGRGLGGSESLPLLQELADCFDRGAVGASRPVVDAGWLPLECQVGQTGQTVAPRLYLALGISGAVQHLAGMKDSELIVAVNDDANAPIFNLAHLGVRADLHRFLPALIEKLKRKR